MNKRPEFDRYTCDGDSISWLDDGFTVTARIERDDSGDKPDERDMGFWPSLDPKSAGYIGPRSRSTLARHMARAKEIMDAWKNDEWWYVGVCVTVSWLGAELTGEYDHACWGVECNYPIAGRGRKANPNKYLGEVARELAQEALADARVKLESLKEKV